ncbi:SCP-like protein, partial [Ostertagia ostertagi]
MLLFLTLLLFLLLLEGEAQQSPVTTAIRTMIVNMHNYRRSRLAQGLVPNGRTGRRAPRGRNIYKIRYSTTLENDAQAYADNCTTTGSPVTSRPTQGENFDRIPSTTATSYQNAIRRMAWASTYEVGCGAKLCTDNYYVVVCRYNP